MMSSLLYYQILVLILLCTCYADPLGEYCNRNTDISSNSQVSANIDKLLAQLTLPKVAQNGFLITSYGKNPDKVYGLVQCRADVSIKDCSGCIQDAAMQIRQRCPNQADARIWYDDCFLRHNTNDDFVGEVDTSFGILYGNVENVSDPETFNKKLAALVDRIESDAVGGGGANKGFGKGETKLSPFVTLYALVQCTRDLAPVDCAQCLAISVSNFQNFCSNRKGCRVLYSSCYVRYELYPFFFPLDSTATAATTAATAYDKVKVYH